MNDAAEASKLSYCYDLVIASCNQGSHPVPCANSGMDQCDEVYGASIVGVTPKFKAPTAKPQPPKNLVLKRSLQALLPPGPGLTHVAGSQSAALPLSSTKQQ
ncbi:MAG: hypothetical protein ABJO09_19100 [Hyphomicrobiales bacterium]